MNKTPLLAVAAATSIAAILSSCSTAPSGASSDGSVTITYAYWGNNSENATLTAMINDFEQANPKITVKANWIQNDYLQQLQTQLAGGKPPTVAQISNTDLAAFASSFKVANVNPSAYYSANIPNAMKIQGKYYATPFVAKTKVMAINTKLWQAAGLDVPSKSTPMNVEDFIANAKKLTKGSGKSKQYGSAPLWFGGWLTVNGGNNYNTDGTSCTLGSPEAIQAADQVIASQTKDGFTPTLLDAQGQDMFDWLSIGRLAAQPDFGPWNIAQLISLKNASDFALVPDPGKGEPMEVDGLAVTKNSKQAETDAANKFISFMSTNQQAQERLTTKESSLGVPVVQSAVPAFEKAAPDQNLQAFVDGVDQAPITASVKANTKISTDWQTALTDKTAIGSGNQSPASVLPELSKQCQATLDAAGPAIS